MNGFDEEKMERMLSSLDIIENNIYVSLGEIRRIKDELYDLRFDNNDRKIEEEPLPITEENRFEEMMAKIDRDFAELEQVDNMQNVDEYNNISRSRSDDYARRQTVIEEYDEEDEDEKDYEHIGLNNYRDIKNIIQNVGSKSKEISKKIDDRKLEMLLSLEEGKLLSIRNENLKKYKKFYSGNLEELEKKIADYYEKIASLADLPIDENEKKKIIQEGLNGLLRFLSNLLLDFSFSKESVKYYNVGRFYNYYKNMKKDLNIRPENGELYNAFLESLLAYSYQANIIRYELNYANNDLVEKHRADTVIYVNNNNRP